MAPFRGQAVCRTSEGDPSHSDRPPRLSSTPPRHGVLLATLVAIAQVATIGQAFSEDGVAGEPASPTEWGQRSKAGVEEAPAAAKLPGDREIREAFRRAHGGFSSDEVLVRQALTDRFLREVGLLPPSASPPLAENSTESPPEGGLADVQRTTLKRLINLRKAGRLDVPTTRRSQTDALPHPMVAEIAVRTLLDRHQVTTDEVLTDPRLRAELQREAEKLQPGVDADQVRKSVLRLRKVRRLRPELVLRVAEWKRRVVTMDLEDVDPAALPDQPGVYLFRSKSGYLYIGEAASLADRIGQHFAGSHNAALSKILQDQASSAVSLELHVFSADSPASRVRMRRAYESELIRSRQPAFNLQP